MIDEKILLDTFADHCGQKSCEGCKLLSKEHCEVYMTITSQPRIERKRTDDCSRLGKLEDKEEKFRWHDLRKNPDDMPVGNGNVLAINDKNGSSGVMVG